MWEQDNKISPAYHFSLEFGQSLRPKADQNPKTQVCWWLVQTNLVLGEFQHDILVILITERDSFSQCGDRLSDDVSYKRYKLEEIQESMCVHFVLYFSKFEQVILIQKFKTKMA